VRSHPRRRPIPLDCPKASELLSEYLDGDLAAAEAGAMRLHLAGCPACARLAAELAATVAAIHGLAAPGVRNRIRRAPGFPA
jgi:anti-sigma factor RsiW